MWRRKTIDVAPIEIEEINLVQRLENFLLSNPNRFWCIVEWVKVFLAQIYKWEKSQRPVIEEWVVNTFLQKIIGFRLKELLTAMNNWDDIQELKMQSPMFEQIWINAWELAGIEELDEQSWETLAA